MNKINRISVLLVLVVFVFISCAKYDDGPSMSLYSKGKRVNGIWYFSQVKYNDRDSTAIYTPGEITFYLGEGSEKDQGMYQWDRGYSPVITAEERMVLGKWNFIADKDSLQMVILAANADDYDTIQWKINRLAFDEF